MRSRQQPRVYGRWAGIHQRWRHERHRPFPASHHCYLRSGTGSAGGLDHGGALRRGPCDPEFSPFLAWRSHLHQTLHRVQNAVGQMAAQSWSVAAMAAVAHASPRHLSRLFALHAGIASLDYLRRIRLAVAQAASLAGFGSDTQLRRAWHQFEIADTPSKTDVLSNK